MSRISDNILDILGDCTITGNTLFLPDKQLDRPTYEAVNKAITNIGGKWNRKAKGHVFDHDPTEGLDNLLTTGETEDMKKVFQFFPTPRQLAETMVGMAEIQNMPHEEKCPVLEPSAGDGAIADVLHEELKKAGRDGGLICVELNEQMKQYLDRKPYPTMYCDFLSLQPGTLKPFSRIVMNPPFTKQQDIDHILHAFSLLADDGILVSVVSESPFYRSNKKSVAFREFLDEHEASVYPVDEGAFKESGTMVRTRIIKLKKFTEG